MSPSNPDPVSIKIAYIGGGSRMWARNILTDLALEPRLTGEVSLFDLDFEACLQNERFGERLKEHPDSRAPFDIVPRRTLKEALEGADFVFMSILPGPMQLMANDIDIPAKYGILQTVGDTVGPGGISRALRTIPIYEEYAREIMIHCPGAWVINYTNPMTLCTAALYAVEPGIKAYGCCHEVFGTQKNLARLVAARFGVDEPNRREIALDIAGVNHFTHATAAHWRGNDLFATLDDYLARDYDWGDQSEWSARQKEKGEFFQSREMVAYDFFRRWGVLGAAGDRHLVEFVPWYLSSRENLERHGVIQTPSSFRLERDRKRLEKEDGPLPEKLAGSGEEGVDQIVAIVGGGDMVTNVNLPNRGQLSQFPEDWVVETYARFSRGQVTPVVARPLPEPVRALVQRVIDVQDLTLEAALRRDKHLAFLALASDPLCQNRPLHDLEAMLDEMIGANAEFLPGEYR